MSQESIADGPFYLKPGGIKESVAATDLGPADHSESRGYMVNGTLNRIPGKRLVNQFADRVLQIATFGGGVFVQHGSTLIYYADACVCVPPGEDVPNPPVIPNNQFIIDLPNSTIGP